jgi:hypothetical protein
MSDQIFTHEEEPEVSSDIEIEVVDDVPEEDRGRIGPGASSVGDDSSRPVEKRINKLKAQYHQERRAKETHQRMQSEAVKYAQRVAKENQDLKGLLNQGEKMLIDEVKARASTDVGRAKEQYRSAIESGDTESIVEAQEALSYASYESKKAEEYIPVTNQPAPAQPVPAQQLQTPQRKPDQKAQEWASRNEWFGSDREMTAYAQAFHETLVTDEKVDPSSEEYYQRIDSTMRERFPDKFGEPASTQVEPSRKQEVHRRPSIVAPARRESGGSAQRKVQLTATQVALAKRLGVTPEQYARQVLELERSNV